MSYSVGLIHILERDGKNSHIWQFYAGNASFLCARATPFCVRFQSCNIANVHGHTGLLQYKRCLGFATKGSLRPNDNDIVKPVLNEAMLGFKKGRACSMDAHTPSNLPQMPQRHYYYFVCLFSSNNSSFGFKWMLLTEYNWIFEGLYKFSRMTSIERYFFKVSILEKKVRRKSVVLFGHKVCLCNPVEISTKRKPQRWIQSVNHSLLSLMWACVCPRVKNNNKHQFQRKKEFKEDNRRCSWESLELRRLVTMVFIMTFFIFL